MHYEAHIQAVIQYHAEFLRERILKRVARTMSLTSEQYMKVIIEHQYLFFLRLIALNFIFLYVIYLMTYVPPCWCAYDMQCWARMVERWCDPAWQENHNTCRERRLLMSGPTHHQGNLDLSEYAARWVREFISLF